MLSGSAGLTGLVGQDGIARQVRPELGTSQPQRLELPQPSLI